jgi:hypothetical protein
MNNKCSGKIVISNCILLCFVLFSTVQADLVFESGYNVFDDTYPPYDEVGVSNDAHLDVLGGEINVKLSFVENSTGNIYDGQISWLWTADNAIVNIYGGLFDFFAFHSPLTSPTVFLYGYDITIHPDGGLNNLPWIEGKYCQNDLPFVVTFDGEDSISRLSVIPEPATLLLLGAGAVLLRRKR